jgi:hypothetical protein
MDIYKTELPSNKTDEQCSSVPFPFKVGNKIEFNKVTIDNLDCDLLDTNFNIIYDNIKTTKKTSINSKTDITNGTTSTEVGRKVDIINKSIYEQPDDSKTEEKSYDVDMLKKMVIKWLKLDDNIKEYNKRAKEIKEEKTQIEDKILSFMNNSNTNEIQVKDGKLEKKCGQKKEPINEEYIKKCLVKSFDDVETVDKLTKMLLESREITETYKLSRKINKVKDLKKKLR